VGAEIAERVLRRLKFSNEQIEPVVRLVKGHMRLTGIPKFTDSAARRLLRDMGEDTERLLTLIEADAAALRPGAKTLDLSSVREKLEQVQREQPPSGFQSPLSGEEIMAFTGLSEGPEVGRLKAILEEKVLEGTLAPGDKEGAETILRAMSR
jgi:poly(A) polymerase